MPISIRKVSTLIDFKIRELLKHTTFLISVILVPGFVFLFRMVYGSMVEGELPASLMAVILGIGVTININSIALMMPATFLAKDKEKYTLRTLMTSSVNAVEYFVASVVPIFLVSVLLNIAVLNIAGVQMSMEHILVFMLLTSIASLTACVFGMIVGLFSKNQMGASNLVTVVMMIFMFIPMFSNISEVLGKISGFLFTGIVDQFIKALVEHGDTTVSTHSWVVLLGGLVAVTVAFIVLYKRNGFEKD